MIAFAIYLLKVIVCSGIMLSYYWMALRNKIFHQWNRFYLLNTVLLSLVIPLIKIDIFINNSDQPVPITRLLTSVSVNEEIIIQVGKHASNNYSAEQVTTLVYLCFSIILLLLVVLSAIRITKIIKQHPAQKIDKVYFLNTEVKGAPFAFLNYIVWNRNIDIHTKTGQQIFRHELAHVQEKHTLDKAFLLLVLIPFWVNPFFWLIRKELHALHEFIADQKSMHTHDTSDLTQMILNSTFPNQSLLFTNHFFYSIIKRRIHMFKKLQNPKISYAGRILVLPLLALIVAAFTLKPKHSIPILNKSITVIIDAGHGGKDAGAIQNNIAEKDLVLALANEIKQINENNKINIILTRVKDETTDLNGRVQLANDNNADLFISLHINAIDEKANVQQKTNSGFEVVVPSKNPSYQSQSELLGAALVQQLSSIYTTVPTLIKKETGIWVLDKNVCPAVLIECGYLNNIKDVNFIKQKENQKLIASKMLRAIELFALNKDQSSVAAFETKDAGQKDIASNKQAANPMTNSTITKTKNVVTTTSPTAIENSNNKLEIKEIANAIAKEEMLPVSKDTIPSKSNDESPVFTKMEQEPKFPGTIEDWRKFLQQKLNLIVPVNNGAPAGTYNVMVQFIVGKDGSLSDIKTLTKNGYGMEEEVLRVMKLSPNWEPAKQNGHIVRAYKKQPVTFVIAQE